MEAVNIGRNVHVSVTLFMEKKLFHIRKFYHDKPSRWGVALDEAEFELLTKKAINIDRTLKEGGGNGTVFLTPNVYVLVMGAQWLQFTKGTVQLFLNPSEWTTLKSHLPAIMRVFKHKSPEVKEEDFPTNITEDHQRYCPACENSPLVTIDCIPTCKACGYMPHLPYYLPHHDI